MQKFYKSIRPSSAERWVNCPGSAFLIDQMDDDYLDSLDSVPAQRGRLMHQVACNILTIASNYSRRSHEDFVKPMFEEPQFDIDGTLTTFDSTEVAQIKTYCHTIFKMVDARGRGWEGVYIEYTYTLTSDKLPLGIDAEEINFSGTVDCIMFDNRPYVDKKQNRDRLRIIDFKTGRVPIDVNNNLQLLCYALLALPTEAIRFTNTVAPKIDLMICQPTVSPELSIWSMIPIPPEPIFINLMRSIAKANSIRTPEALEDNLKLGNHCTYCPAKPICPLMHKMIKEIPND